MTNWYIMEHFEIFGEDEEEVLDWLEYEEDCKSNPWDF